jgi:hypothetical protein
MRTLITKDFIAAAAKKGPEWRRDVKRFALEPLYYIGTEDIFMGLLSSARTRNLFELGCRKTLSFSIS